MCFFKTSDNKKNTQKNHNTHDPLLTRRALKNDDGGGFNNGCDIQTCTYVASSDNITTLHCTALSLAGPWRRGARGAGGREERSPRRLEAHWRAPRHRAREGIADETHHSLDGFISLERPCVWAGRICQTTDSK